MVENQREDRERAISLAPSGVRGQASHAAPRGEATFRFLAIDCCHLAISPPRRASASSFCAMGAGASSSSASKTRKRACATHVFEAVTASHAVTWADYQAIAAEALAGTVEGDTPTALQLLAALDQMAAHRAEERMELPEFVEVHLRCGELLTASDFDVFGDLLTLNMPSVEDEMDDVQLECAAILDSFLQSRKVDGGDEASDDEQ